MTLSISYGEESFRIEAISCGRVDYSHYISVWHDHPVYHLILVSKGRHYFDYDNRQSELINSNTLILINPGAKHLIRQLGTERFEHIGLLWSFVDKNGQAATFPLQKLLGVPDVHCPPVELCRLPQYEVQKCNEQYSSLLALMNGIDAASCWEFKFFNLLYTLLEQFRPEKKLYGKDAAQQDHLVDAVEQMLLMNISNRNFNINTIADKLGRSPNYLSTLYRRKFGCSIGNSLQQKRMERAQALLQLTNDQVQTIAEQCGFATVGYFCRRFDRQFGISPLRYRQQKRERSEVFNSVYRKVVQADHLAVSEHQ